MNDTQWLKTLDVGSDVAILSASGGCYYFAQVERVTKQHFVVRGSKYRKTNGHEATSSVWYQKSIQKPTPEIVEAEMKARRMDRIRRIDWRDVDDNTIQHVLALVEPKQGA